MKIVKLVSSILLGIVFLFSGYSKLISVEAFELEVYSIFNQFLLTSIFTKAIIALEFLIGLSFVLNFYGSHKWIYKVAVILIALFTLYLIPDLINNPFKNCQCFGELLPMNPLESILKNLGILILLFVLRNYQGFLFFNKFSRITTVSIITLAFGAFAFQMALAQESVITYTSLERRKLNLPKLKSQPRFSKIQLKNNDFVVFFSATCPHCYMIAKQLVQIQKTNVIEPLIFVNGDSLEYLKFVRETQLKTPQMFNLNGPDFINRFGGQSLPSMYLVRNDTVYFKVRVLAAYEVDQINKWVNNKKEK